VDGAGDGHGDDLCDLPDDERAAVCQLGLQPASSYSAWEPTGRSTTSQPFPPFTFLYTYDSNVLGNLEYEDVVAVNGF
jgi:hypothetical protein